MSLGSKENVGLDLVTLLLLENMDAIKNTDSLSDSTIQFLEIAVVVTMI